MSGLVAVLNSPQTPELEDMLQYIRHRGPALAGTCWLESIGLGQNYTAGDIGPAAPDGGIPLTQGPDGPAVCFDGQIGNLSALARRFDVDADSGFLEERLLLEIYRRHGQGMLPYLRDAVFAIVISDGRRFLAARDLLGIKTLFYGRKKDTLFFGSELKSITAVADTVYEFPPGHVMDETGRLEAFAELAETPPPAVEKNPDVAVAAVRDIILRSVSSRVGFQAATGSLLSGGVDSSIVAALASRGYQAKYGEGARLPTFALGVGESEDIVNARRVADHIGSDHHELIVDLDEMLAVLPDVIYALESFDPSLVRSAVSNYLITRHAHENGIEILLSGEGGDEVFCGYTHLKALEPQDLFAEQVNCLRLLHNNAALRLDRMNQCHSVRVVAPLISGELLDYALALAPELKIRKEGEQRIEKWALRKAFEDYLPSEVAWRLKKEFSQGSGSADVLPGHFEKTVSDKALAAAREKYPMVRSKEELHYFQLFVDRFGDGSAVATVGQWVSL